MSFESVKKSLSIVLSLTLIATASQMVCDAQTPAGTTAADSGSPAETATQTASELQALVAPIALYPDSLVAQILTAVTFPGRGCNCQLLDWTKQESQGGAP